RTLNSHTRYKPTLPTRRSSDLHPHDHSDDRVAGGRVEARAPDGVRAGKHGLPDDLRDTAQLFGQRPADRLRLHSDLLQHLRPVKLLAAGEEPDLEALRALHLAQLPSVAVPDPRSGVGLRGGSAVSVQRWP